jgi:hypothetical protein
MRPQKITIGEMRDEIGVRGVLVCCADYRCGHSMAMNADRWTDDVRLSDIEPRFVCAASFSRPRAQLPGKSKAASITLRLGHRRAIARRNAH